MTILRRLKNAGKYTIFNLIGLTLGLCLTTLIVMLIMYEISFDKFHTNADKILCVLQNDLKDGSINASTPYPLPNTLKNDFPEVKSVVGFNHIMGDRDIDYQNITYSGFSGATVRADVFSIFDFNLLLGKESDVLNGPDKVVISQKTAKKIFGSENPVGKEIQLRKIHFTITGVFDDLPDNSSMHFDLLFSEKLNEVIWSQSPVAWWATALTTFVILNDGVSVTQFNEHLKQIPDLYYPDFLKGRSTYSSIPFRDLHFDTSIHGGLSTPISVKYLLILGLIALLTLSIACINFISLSTVNSGKKSIETGIRKISGASTFQVIWIYLKSSAAVMGISLVLAILLAHLILPFFEHYVNRPLASQLYNPLVWAGIFLLGVIVIIITGTISGLSFSRLQPVSVLKSHGIIKHQNPLKRGAFVVFQFVLTIGLLVSQFFIYKQIKDMQHADLGFNYESVTAIDVGGLKSEVDYPYKKIKTYKAELERQGAEYGLTQGSVTENIPGYYFQNSFTVIPEDADIEECLVVSTAVDENYLDLYDIDLLHGRFFSTKYKTDHQAFVINETAFKKFGWETIEGKSLRLSHEGGSCPVIGVVNDIVETSLREKTNPMIFRFEQHNAFPAFLSYRIIPENYSETIAFMQSTWEDMFSGIPFQTINVKEVYYANYDDEKELIQVISIMSLFAILLSIIGLMGIVAYIAETRTKEIGIRKVNGAKTSEVLTMLNSNFVKWVTIAFFIATPIAWFAMQKWLENFAYKTNLSWWIFALAGISALLIALLTVSWQSWRAATRNPVKALRYE